MAFLNTKLVLITLRLIHILSGVLWVGGATLLATFVLPAARDETGLAYLRRLIWARNLPRYLNVTLVLALLSGLLMYGNLSSSPAARGLDRVWAWRSALGERWRSLPRRQFIARWSRPTACRRHRRSPRWCASAPDSCPMASSPARWRCSISAWPLANALCNHIGRSFQIWNEHVRDCCAMEAPVGQLVSWSVGQFGQHDG